jgi:cytochrome oxidase assembly protein ShyY1
MAGVVQESAELGDLDLDGFVREGGQVAARDRWPGHHAVAVQGAALVLPNRVFTKKTNSRFSQYALSWFYGNSILLIFVLVAASRQDLVC